MTVNRPSLERRVIKSDAKTTAPRSCRAPADRVELSISGSEYWRAVTSPDIHARVGVVSRAAGNTDMGRPI